MNAACDADVDKSGQVLSREVVVVPLFFPCLVPSKNYVPYLI